MYHLTTYLDKASAESAIEGLFAIATLRLHLVHDKRTGEAWITEGDDQINHLFNHHAKHRTDLSPSEAIHDAIATLAVTTYSTLPNQNAAYAFTTADNVTVYAHERDVVTRQHTVYYPV